MLPIDRVLNIAKQELGYLEKKSDAYLYDKTANAGSGNYTKYWAEIKPEYQGQPWCACYVTWVFVQAFGVEMTRKLLKHYPYVYCPTMAQLFKLNANPKVGDIVIFKHNGEFTHTGIVNGVNGDYFTTYEGNTSGASGIIPNGGGVCAKGYYNSQLPGTKFITVNWDLVKEDEFKFTETPVQMEGIITAGELNVRQRPTTESDIIAKHVAGDNVIISAKTDNGWYRVDYPFGTGYIYSQYVKAWNAPVEETITQEEFNNFVDNYVRELDNKQPSPWSVDARNYCESHNIFKGDENGNKKYRAYLTREELAVLLFNFYKGEIEK